VRPYYSENGITIYHGDCRQILPYLPEVDLVIADPPYGIDYQSNHRTMKFDKIHGDSAFPTEWMDSTTKLVDRGSMYLFCNEASLADAKAALHSYKWSSNRLLIWDKQNSSGGDLENYGLRTEFILYGTKMFAPKLNGSRDGNLISIPRVRPQDLKHPNEKPYLLMAYLIMKSTNPMEVVLDPFMGSGVSLLAARDLGRKAIGIEIEERYCEVAARYFQQGVLAFA
jgi:site-specific DNA-methyltransferase (adenine-specific)